jgi:hypothetical protein
VGGGTNNLANQYGAVVSGGAYNAASGERSSVCGGQSDTASGNYSFVGGGNNNKAGDTYTAVAGGHDNTASYYCSFIGGGSNNAASATHSCVPGGYNNTAGGSYSFAAGRNAKAHVQGVFVWGDANTGTVDAWFDNSWVARCSGGVYFFTNSAMTSGVYVAAGGNAWSAVCDRNMKENFKPVDGAEVLAKLSHMPITTWNYKSQDKSIRHIGPMAQDFASFGVGEDDKHITTIDADGIALAAIQELNKKLDRLEAENRELRRRLELLERR